MSTSPTRSKEATTVVVVGATGFVGKNLVRTLLSDTTYSIRAVARDVTQFGISHPRLEILSGDVLLRKSMEQVLQGADVVYYFVHALDRKDGRFDVEEALAAETFGAAARNAGVSRVIYMSGLGRDTEKLSRHLASRHATGDILRKYIPTVLEFRASMIIGRGSASFEMIRSLVGRLPIMILPRWSKTLTQPIGIDDAIAYLVAGITVPIGKHEIVEIGGQEKISYQNFLKRYAEVVGKHRFLIRVPILPEWIAGWWLYLFLPKDTARIGRHLIGSFRNEMTVTNNRAQELFPSIIPKPIEHFLTR